VKIDKTGKRLFAHDPSFELYPCDTDDTTLKTALIKALDNIFLTVESTV